nr:uncharacterized protein LOC105093089 isoform X2 [Camelus dromedarius]
MARKMVRAAGWCLTCLDALEAAGDAASLRGPFADLAAALQRLGGLTARRSGERLGAPAACCGAASPRCSRPPAVASATLRPGAGRLPAPPSSLWPGRNWASSCGAGSAPRPLRRRPATARSAGACGSCASCWGAGRGAARRPAGRAAGGRGLALHAPGRLLRTARAPAPGGPLPPAAGATERRRPAPGPDRRASGDGGGSQEPAEECAALRTATEDLSQEVRTGLLRQILDTFTDTQSPLQRLVQAALATSPVSSPCDGEALPERLQRLLAAFHDQAKQMLRVARLVLVCCPRQQTGKDMEATMVGLWGLVVRVQQLFSQSPQGSGLDRSPATLQALLQEWARASEGLLACFDDVLNIPEFLRVSVQEMTKRLDLFTWTLRSGDSRECSPLAAYLQGRATHIVQVMSRYVDQDRDPIFRNGLRVLIQQLEQSSLVLGATAQHCAGGHSSQDSGALLTMARHLIFSAQSI